MPLFSIIETEGGLTVAELEPGTLPDDAAVKHGGVVVDPGPYKTYEDAYDAMMAIGSEDDDEEEEGLSAAP
jgi:hypothetical protein